jgi:hypothetical protein
MERMTTHPDDWRCMGSVRGHIPSCSKVRNSTGYNWLVNVVEFIAD